MQKNLILLQKHHIFIEAYFWSRQMVTLQILIQNRNKNFDLADSFNQIFTLIKGKQNLLVNLSSGVVTTPDFGTKDL